MFLFITKNTMSISYNNRLKQSQERSDNRPEKRARIIAETDKSDKGEEQKEKSEKQSDKITEEKETTAEKEQEKAKDDIEQERKTSEGKDNMDTEPSIKDDTVLRKTDNTDNNLKNAQNDTEISKGKDNSDELKEQGKEENDKKNRESGKEKEMENEKEGKEKDGKSKPVLSERDVQRNRRLFSLFQRGLNSIKQDNAKRAQQELKRRELEEKIEAKGIEQRRENLLHEIASVEEDIAKKKAKLQEYKNKQDALLQQSQVTFLFLIFSVIY